MPTEAAREARELYVYFRASVERRSEIGDAAHTMQQRLISTFPALTAALLRRPDDGSGRDTWMETYAWAGGRVDEVTDATFGQMLAKETGAWQHLLDGPRHLEVFLRCA